MSSLLCSRCGDFIDHVPSDAASSESLRCRRCLERPREVVSKDLPSALKRALLATLLGFFTSAILTLQLRLAAILGATFGLLFLAGAGLAHAEPSLRQRVFLLALVVALSAPFLMLAQLLIGERYAGLGLLAALAILTLGPGLLVISGWLRLILAWRRGEEA